MNHGNPQGTGSAAASSGSGLLEPARDFDEASLRVERALDQLRRGGMVLVLDDADRENEGDLIIPASRVTADQMAFILAHGSGFICVALDEHRADELGLTLMHPRDANEESHGTAFTIPVDHTACGKVGASAGDRAITARLLARDGASSADFVSPGAIFPLRAQPGGVLKRAGHTEAALDLARLSGHAPAAVLSEVMRNGRMLRPNQLARFAADHGLPTLCIADLILYRRRQDAIVQRTATALLPTKHGEFQAIAYQSVVDGVDHLALTLGTIGPRALVRVHSECLTGDVLGSRRCDCGQQLELAMKKVAELGSGVIVYLRGHEGRGIGLGHKLRAYALQDTGLDTVDANSALGLPVDPRDYGIGAAILADLGVETIRLMTNNPNKITGLVGYGLEVVERVPLVAEFTPENEKYLQAKTNRLRHRLHPEPRYTAAEPR